MGIIIKTARNTHPRPTANTNQGTTAPAVPPDDLTNRTCRKRMIHHRLPCQGNPAGTTPSRYRISPKASMIPTPRRTIQTLRSVTHGARTHTTNHTSTKEDTSSTTITPTFRIGHSHETITHSLRGVHPTGAHLRRKTGLIGNLTMEEAEDSRQTQWNRQVHQAHRGVSPPTNQDNPDILGLQDLLDHRDQQDHHTTRIPTRGFLIIGKTRPQDHCSRQILKRTQY